MKLKNAYPVNPSLCYQYRAVLIVFLLLFVDGLFSSTQVIRAQTPADPSVAAERLLQEGLQAYRAQQLAQALVKLKQAYQLVPQNTQVRLTLGLMLYEENPASLQAQQLLESVAAQFASNTELQLKLLDSYLQSNSKVKVVNLLQGLSEAMTHGGRFAFDVSYTLIRYSELELAQGILDNIESGLKPRVIGLTELELKAPAHAALMHETGELYFLRAMIAASRGDKSEALRLFQAADRFDVPARNSLQMEMLAEALFQLAEYPLAIQAYEEYLKSGSGDVGTRMHLGIAYYSTALFAKARDNFERVLMAVPQTQQAHLYLGMTLVELKQTDMSRLQFLEELKLDAQSYQAMSELAYLDYLDGKNRECLAWLEKSRQVNPDWIQTNMVFGLLYNRLGQFERAVEALERAVRDKPDYSRAHFQLSLAYRRLGNDIKAKEHSDIYERLTAAEKARQLGNRMPANQ